MEFEQRVPWLRHTFSCQAVISAVLLSVVTAYLGRRKQVGGHLFEVVIKHHGRPRRMTGYWDSGNQLRDPFNGRPVCILCRELAEKIFEPETEMVRFIPYTSLGTQKGLLPVVFADQMEIEGNGKRITIKPAEIGIANAGLLEEKEYDLILHASLLEENKKGAENDSKICNAKV